MTRSARAAALAAAGLLTIAAPAAAADRTYEFDGLAAATQSFTSGAGVGVLGDATITDNVPCDTPGRDCETTLVKLGERGKLTFDALGEQTVVDVDVFLFRSDDKGTQGSEIASAVEFDADETVTASGLKPGFYLVRVDWMTGAGTYAGKLAYTPQPLPAPKA